MNFKEPIKNGFSIIELIIAGAISITAISVGFSLLQIALKGNKIDETQMGLNGRINAVSYTHLTLPTSHCV